MTKQLSFDVVLTVEDDVDKEWAQTVVKAMLEDVVQDDNYHDILIVDDVSAMDESTMKLLDVLDNLSDDDVQAAIETVEVLENDD